MKTFVLLIKTESKSPLCMSTGGLQNDAEVYQAQLIYLAHNIKLDPCGIYYFMKGCQ